MKTKTIVDDYDGDAATLPVELIQMGANVARDIIDERDPFPYSIRAESESFVLLLMSECWARGYATGYATGRTRTYKEAIA